MADRKCVQVFVWEDDNWVPPPNQPHWTTYVDDGCSVFAVVTESMAWADQTYPQSRRAVVLTDVMESSPRRNKKVLDFVPVLEWHNEPSTDFSPPSGEGWMLVEVDE